MDKVFEGHIQNNDDKVFDEGVQNRTYKLK